MSKQTGLINNPGSASGPAIRSLTPVGYTAPFVVTTDVNAVTWDVTTSSKPATIGWLLDGTRQTGAVTQNGPTGLAWRFDWNMKTLDDGAYVVAAEASDVYGVSGPGRQETIVLNRFVPRAPKQVTGGRTGFGTVEIEWTANSERDVVGYQVFRVGAATPVCEITTQKLDTFCTDTSPPSDATLEYYVRAYDKDTSGNLRASADSTHLLVTKDNTAPFQVTGLTLQTLASGDTKLTWSRAGAGGPRRRRQRLVLPHLPRRDRAGRPLRALLRRQRQPVRHLDRHRHRRHPAQLLGHRGRPAVPRVAVRRAGDGMTPRTRDEAGFTVIELAVAAAISLVVLGATMSLLISMMTQRTATEGHADAAQQARQGIDRLSRQLRNLASPADVITNSALIKPKSVDRNLPFDLVFKDVDEGALTSREQPRERAPRALLPADERLDPRRRRGHDRARRAVDRRPSAPRPGRRSCPRPRRRRGAAPGPDGTTSAGSPTTSSTPATSPPDPLFRYSSASGEITATDDAAREQIIRVEADLHVDPDPAKRPLAAHITSSVVLRNQNRAPSAFFSYVVTNSLACTLQLNGSGSEDPENKRLTYTWYLRRRAARHRPAEPGARPAHRADRRAHLPARGQGSGRPRRDAIRKGNHRMHLRSRLADARGSALIPALLITAILLGFGMASLSLVDGEQRDSRRERERESSFQLAEGVLNAEIYRLSTRWPGKVSTPYPSECTATSTHADCPGGATLQANFSGPDYTRPTSWKVQVRDNADGAQKNFYSESLINGSTTYNDANGDNFLWVRAEADVAGRKRVLVALVEAENVTLNFPNATLVAGKFEVSNNGNKVMIDTNGVNNEWTPGDIIVRCALTRPELRQVEPGQGPDRAGHDPQQPGPAEGGQPRGARPAPRPRAGRGQLLHGLRAVAPGRQRARRHGVHGERRGLPLQRQPGLQQPDEARLRGHRERHADPQRQRRVLRRDLPRQRERVERDADQHEGQHLDLRLDRDRRRRRPLRGLQQGQPRLQPERVRGPPGLRHRRPRAEHVPRGRRDLAQDPGGARR